jgi:hypothetical protein
MVSLSIASGAARLAQHRERLVQLSQKRGHRLLLTTWRGALDVLQVLLHTGVMQVRPKTAYITLPKPLFLPCEKRRMAGCRISSGHSGLLSDF